MWTIVSPCGWVLPRRVYEDKVLANSVGSTAEVGRCRFTPSNTR